MTQPTHVLAQLPTEVLTLTLSHLTTSELLFNVAPTCRMLRTVTELDSLWSKENGEYRDLELLMEVQESNVQFQKENRTLSDETQFPLVYESDEESDFARWMLRKRGKTARERIMALARLGHGPYIKNGVFFKTVAWLARLVRFARRHGLVEYERAMAIGGRVTSHGDLGEALRKDCQDNLHKPRKRFLTRKVPDTLACLLALCEGEYQSQWGTVAMLGTSEVYNQRTSLTFVHPVAATFMTAHFSRRLSGFDDAGCVIFAWDPSSHAEFLSVTSIPQTHRGGLRPCLLQPGSVLSWNRHGYPAVVARSFDTYMETFVRNVETGVYPVFPSERYISRYPTAGNAYGVSKAVTNGIEVVFSPLLLECAFEEDDNDGPPSQGRFNWSYCLRLRLLPECEHQTVQLKSRKWHVTDEIRQETETVSGDGVIGEYPVLVRLDEKEVAQTNYPSSVPTTEITSATRAKLFEYCSRTGFASPEGTMGGSLTFIPGTITSPEGEPIEAVVAPARFKYDPAGLPI